MKRHNPNRAIALFGVLVMVGCAMTPGTPSDDRQQWVEAKLRALGLEDDPEVEEQRAAVEAAIAREKSSPVLDAFELRATAIHETDDKLKMLARVPLENLFSASAQRAARRAETDVEVAQLTEVALEQRVRLCIPSLDRLVQTEEMQIYDRFAERQRTLLDWNRELREAGMLDEVGAEHFELAGQVRLARSLPAPPAPNSAFDTEPWQYAILPRPASSARELKNSPQFVREQLLLNHPGVDVHRAKGRSFAARARQERVGRYPSLRFVEFGFEPTTFPGDTRQYDAQVALEIPFGREAAASERRFRALASGQRSAERALIERSVSETRAAVEVINEFRRRGAYWLGLLVSADDAEKIADRWQQKRMTSPDAIANLLDEVYDARITVLKAQERAGYAGCAVLATTGIVIDQWPL